MTESPDYTDDSQSRSIAQWMRHSTTFKLVFIGLLALFLMYPVGLVDDLVSEREQARGQVVNEISQKWGNDQTLVGPILTIPVDIRHNIDEGDETRIRTERIRAHFLPNELDSAPSGSSRSSRS
jgi:inner membrane protein